MKLSEFLKKKRKDLGLTKIQLAERSDVVIRFVRELERGKKTLQMEKFTRF